ncbi:hypothetical protein BGAPBR_I0020 (plasmid) [Borreliella garinii PBr]|uniref:Uncharacterized protein n=1 Tax=Borreliella garinii PBr TaxID=498743 RepID=B8F0Z9_BORGR|nr:hypothetical protein BGAPBR_I0020 [Borreliella garinii PBr]
MRFFVTLAFKRLLLVPNHIFFTSNKFCSILLGFCWIYEF